MNLKFKILLNFIFFFLQANTLIVEFCPYVERIPCLQGDDKPKPDQNNNLEITLYYKSFADQSMDSVVYGNICQLISNCGNNISVRLVPGADAAVNYPVSKEIVCSGSDCKLARQQICYGFIDKKYLNMCKTPNASKEEMNSCFQNQMDDINNQLLANSDERKKKGIATCHMPALTFQGNYESPLCAQYSTYEELRDYVCKEIYKNTLQCCPK